MMTRTATLITVPYFSGDSRWNTVERHQSNLRKPSRRLVSRSAFTGEAVHTLQNGILMTTHPNLIKKNNKDNNRWSIYYDRQLRDLDHSIYDKKHVVCAGQFPQADGQTHIESRTHSDVTVTLTSAIIA